MTDPLFNLRREDTDRGFGRYEFIDRYDEKCSLQESSLASEAAIWLGIDAIMVTEKTALLGPKGPFVLARMHLTQDMVREVLPILQHFAETGRLP